MTTSPATNPTPATTSATTNLLQSTSVTTSTPPTTTNLPQSTTNMISTNSKSTNLIPTTYATTDLLPATSTTTNLPPTIDEENLILVPVIEEEVDDVDEEDNLIVVPVNSNTPRPSLYLHNETPGGTTYWEPDVEEEYLPLEGKRFDTIEECIEFYNVYAEKGGFEVKKSSQKTTLSGLVKAKYVMCNREGLPRNITINTLNPQDNVKQIRNTRHRITGCMARIKIVLDSISGKYKITKFVSKHNHQLLPKEYKHLTKKQRRTTQAEKTFVVRASTMRLGATKAHHLYSRMKGGTQYVHGTSDDFKNHMRDVNAFIGESDAQMLINKMISRMDYAPNFSFHVFIDNSELVAMFWADEVAKCNYKEFGDIISFDATFRTNKYDMVFVPFTGIDNHRKCVNVGSGLLLKEDTEAYTWLLTSFMKAHEKQPTMIVTDQDGAMKKAIEAVLPESKHRLCMWHIMQKVPAKICPDIYDKTDFKERFGKLVWNMFIEPLEFEEKWSKLVDDFGLQNHKWMTKMYNIRHMWIPAYFIDSPLFGLMRTTSRSESENAFFKNFTNHGSTLVNFMMCFEIAMEMQNYRQHYLDFGTFDAAPKPTTQLDIKIHACKVYTRTISLLVQKEIYEACWACQIQEFKEEEGCEFAKVRDIRAGAYRTLYTEEGKEMVIQEKDKVVDYKVMRNPEDGSIECTCRHFLRFGFLCRHAFCVLKNRNIKLIPERYILRRWRRDIIPPSLRRNTNRYGEKDEVIEKLTNDANFVVDECLFWLRKDEAELRKFVETLENIRKEIQAKVPRPPQKTRDVIEDIYAIKMPKENEVNNPQRARNKGGRRGERKKSGREIAMKAKAKRARKCGHCGEKTNKHTKSTCPLNPKYIAKLARMEAEKEKTEATTSEAAANEQEPTNTAANES